MNPIQQFEITEMLLSGFKCFANTTEIEFGPRTVITGGNGRGKSSVADAVAFAVTGLPFFGERGNDRLVSETGDGLTVTMRFLDETGQTHILTRQWDKTRTNITYDGVQIRQSDITELFGEKDVFLSIFNPLYFIEELGTDGRKLLERYLPAISQEMVLPLLSDEARTLLESENILSPENFLSKRRSEIRELEQQIIYMTGQKDLAAAQKEDAAAKVLLLEGKLSSLDQEHEALEARRFAGIDLSAVQERLADLSARYEEMAKDSPESADTAAVDAQIRELRERLAVRASERYAPKFSEHIAEYSAKIQEITTRYKRETGLLKGFQVGTVCPMCRRGVTEEELPVIRGELQQSVNAIVAEGREATAKLEELKALERQSEETFRSFQAEDVAKLNAALQACNEQRTAAAESAAAQREQRKADLDQLLAEIRSLSTVTECGNLTPEESERLIVCRQEIKECKTELLAAKQLSELCPEDFDLKIAAVQDQIADKKKLLGAVAQYVAKRAELLFSKLEMNRVRISLFDVIKSTGEVKDVFNFTYNGRRYDRLSLSEKVRAGMEVSELVKRLTGRNYPQFVDNTESVDDLANVRPSGQVIMARCIRGADLSIRVAGPTQSGLQQAA